MTLEQAEKTFTGDATRRLRSPSKNPARNAGSDVRLLHARQADDSQTARDYKKKLGTAYTLEKFHDELLSRGDPPLPLLRPFILGDSDDGKPL